MVVGCYVVFVVCCLVLQCVVVVRWCSLVCRCALLVDCFGMGLLIACCVALFWCLVFAVVCCLVLVGAVFGVCRSSWRFAGVACCAACVV